MTIKIFGDRQITLSKDQVKTIVESVVDYVEGNGLHKLTLEEQTDYFTCTIYNWFIKKHLKKRVNVAKETYALDLEIRRLQKKKENLKPFEN